MEQSSTSGWTKETIFTIGHSTRSIALFVDLLRSVAADLIVDVRTMPRSWANPQFNADALPGSLATAGIGYCHIPELGGLRHRPKGGGTSPNGLWRNASFRNYADYASTDAFRSGLGQLRALAAHHRCAVMCAEALWWRCHRRIIADYLLAAQVPVAHIMGLGKVEAATLTPGARPLADGRVTYPAARESGQIEMALRPPSF